MKKLLFRLSAILKILFLLNIPLIIQYDKYLFRNRPESHTFDNLNLEVDLNFPWYFYLFSIIIVGGYLLNLIAINLYAFKPCGKISKFFHQSNPSKLIYGIEIVLFICAIIIGYNKFDDAFATRNYGIWGELLKPLVNSNDAKKLLLIDKLNAFNFILSLISSIIILTTFWHVRKKNQIRCTEE